MNVLIVSFEIPKSASEISLDVVKVMLSARVQFHVESVLKQIVSVLVK